MNTLTLAKGAHGETSDRADEKAKIQKNRVQFDLAPRSMERLNALKAKTEAASYAEVVKNALRLYEALKAVSRSLCATRTAQSRRIACSCNTRRRKH